MKKLLHFRALSLGFAIFAMFFGAGNVIFPLALGQSAGDQSLFAFLGLSFTAVVIPLAGFIAIILYEGDYRAFFGRIGKIPGFILAFFIISLLGPLGSAPRCITVAFTTFKGIFSHLSLPLFSALSCILIFISIIKKRFVLTLLGWVLTPLLLISLLAIILMGLFAPSEASPSELSKAHLFLHGLQEGYHTMDLLAAFFFSSTILSRLKKGQHSMSSVIGASVIGACLLCATYLGFSTIAALHSASLSIQGKEELLNAVTMKIAGPFGSILVCATVTLACFTTAIALITAFTEFILMVQHSPWCFSNSNALCFPWLYFGERLFPQLEQLNCFNA